jgi:general secretion pathway protein F
MPSAMAAFEYEALDATGRRMRGLLAADSEAAARRELRRRRLAPLSVSRADRAGAGAKTLLERLSGPRPISSRELMGVTRQLATLVDAGMPVEEAVGLVGGQDASPAASRVLMGVRARITEGERLSDAMASEPRSFPAVYRAMIAAGEGAGGLALVLDRLADYLEKSDALKSKVSTALIYPSVLGVVALGVVTVLLTVIVPRISEQFESMGMALPALTRFMIGLSGFLSANGLTMLAGLAALALAGGFAMRREPVRKRVHAMRLGLPVLGGFERKVEAARFARTMGILIASGAVLPDALRAARRATANLVFQDTLSAVVDQVETGRGLADALRGAQAFPPIMVYMVAAGERSGRLAEMFQRSAEHLEADIDGAVTAGLSLLEPGIILAMGAVVVLIVLSILLPILQLNTSVLI